MSILEEDPKDKGLSPEAQQKVADFAEKHKLDNTQTVLDVEDLVRKMEQAGLRLENIGKVRMVFSFGQEPEDSSGE